MMYTVQQAMLPQQAAAFDSAFFPFDREHQIVLLFQLLHKGIGNLLWANKEDESTIGMLGGQRKALLHRVGSFH